MIYGRRCPSGGRPLLQSQACAGDFLGGLGHPVRHGRREERRLSLGRRSAQNGLDVSCESPVEHLVGLVQYEQSHRVQVECALPQVVQSSPGSADYDVRASLQCRVLGLAMTSRRRAASRAADAGKPGHPSRLLPGLPAPWWAQAPDPGPSWTTGRIAPPSVWRKPASCQSRCAPAQSGHVDQEGGGWTWPESKWARLYPLRQSPPWWRRSSRFSEIHGSRRRMLGSAFI